MRIHPYENIVHIIRALLTMFQSTGNIIATVKKAKNMRKHLLKQKSDVLYVPEKRCTVNGPNRVGAASEGR